MSARGPQRDGVDDLVRDKSRTPAMFDAIARRYDLLNHLLSFNIDRRWRRELVNFAGVREGERVLDVATGTADVAIEFAKRTGAGAIVGLDPSAGMIAVGREKLARASLADRVTLVDGDALALPFDDASFDVVTIAFGLRNLPDYRRGVAEMTRVLRTGGRLLVLDFAPPRGARFMVQRAYFSTLLPFAGKAVSGYGGAYRYLVASIRDFMDEGGVRDLFGSHGLAGFEARHMTGGIVMLYRGVKS
ncbi:MAG TPA: ubiquinone/menaquinone biosynthesis methyltransferase [Candidatus Krumholzibacteria bacterium]|nr:ubiquinone/menaquinone biosynthesis methyltransferase [Candidatus Krumholzibacteria bacterium]